MFGTEPPEPPHPGQKVLAVIFTVFFFVVGIIGLVSGDFYLPSRFGPGQSLEGLNAYLVSTSFIVLAAFFSMALMEWNSESLQKLLAKILFVLFLLLIALGVFL